MFKVGIIGLGTLLVLLCLGKGVEGGGRRRSGGVPAEYNNCLKTANEYRQRHKDTPDLKWDAGLAKKAKAYADEMMENVRGHPKTFFKHDSDRGYVGENLWYLDHPYRGNTGYYCRKANKDWYDEIKYYSYTTRKSTNSEKQIGHFTQMVWKQSRKVGYGVAIGDSPKFKGNTMAIVVARYTPPGNIGTQYVSNVKTLGR